MKYGEIYWAKQDTEVGSEQAGRRPVLIISCDEAIKAISTVVTTVPLTTKERDWPTRIRIDGDDTGLVEPAWAICEQARTISARRIAARLGEVDTGTLVHVNRVLRYLLNL